MLALLLMLAGMAVPLFSGAMAGRRLIESAEQFRSLMFMTGSEARQAGRRLQVAFPTPAEEPNFLADYAGDKPVGAAYREASVLIERDPLGAPGAFDPLKADFARWSTNSSTTQIARIEISEPIPVGGNLTLDSERKEQPPVIVFGPDGRSLVGDVTVTIVNDRLAGYLVQLRGATGLATIAPMPAVEKK